MEPRSIRVAVIGAGMAGLVAARELQRENHDVVVFEKSNQVGGLWVYDPRTETDPMSLDPTREIVHSSMYRSLRTNLPRPVMDFLDYPFVPKDDPRIFPGREEVLRFLDGFAVDFELNGLIRFGSAVVRVERVGGGESGKWVVEWRTLDGADDSDEEVFDAVVVCNGHHTQPRVVEFPGRSTWPGKQLHSHNYRIPEPYKDQIVLIIGNGPSALDISNDLIPFAKQVHQASRVAQYPDQLPRKISTAILQHPMIKCAQEDGTLIFEDGTSIYVDVILHCTGYVYDFPFLRTNDIVTIDDNRVGPLYKHVFPPSLAPNLSFIGLTYQPNVEMVMELQSKWVARVLSGKMVLPNEQQMMESVQQHYKRMEEMGRPKHHSHQAFEMENKFGYQKWLIDIMGLPALEKWREDLIDTFLTHIAKNGLSCRDQWDADTQIQEIERYRELSNC